MLTFTPIQDSITPDTMLPDLFAAHPHLRRVFDCYGLRGCGGRNGPAESIAFFAKAHGVNLATLMGELQQALRMPAPTAEPEPPPALADTIYRRYFLGGIILILTAGATWGAWLLWQIGFAGKFTGISIHHVNAHGHAQIYGWVGLFIMGFAYQAFPRIWHTTLAAPWLAATAFVAMATGLVLRTVGMTAAGAGTWALAAAAAGGMLELAAILVFCAQMLLTFGRSSARVEPYVGFVVMALFWFAAQAAFDVWYTLATMRADRTTLLWYVSTFQAPLRDLQIHGLALFMVLGVSLRMLPALFDLPAIAVQRAWIALGLLTVAVAAEASLFVIYRLSHNYLFGALLMLPWLALAGGCWMIAGPWRLWRPMPTIDRTAKFVRAAYGWLAVSLAMLLLLPVYQWLSGIDFSHAYYGAIRHAITVGFISLMIMGMAAKVVPTLNGFDHRTLGGLWGPFILVNTGCFLRVSLQTLTDWHPGFFAAVGVSGVLEVSGLAWWGTHLIALMVRGKREVNESAAATVPSGPVGEDWLVLDVLRWLPQSAPVFDRHGFTLLRNPIARRTVARGVTLKQAARLRGVDMERLLADLRAVQSAPSEAKVQA